MQSEIIKSKLNKKIYLLIAIGFLMISMILLLSHIVSSRFKNSQDIWKTNIHKEVVISEALAVLNRNIGYGGFIHNLKNLIIRRDLSRYQEVIERNIIELSRQLQKIKGLVTSENELIAIRQLQSTFDEYKIKYEIAKEMIIENKTTSEIDAAVKVSDVNAFAAMNVLSSSIKKRIKKVEDSLIPLKSDALRAIQFARFLITIFIVTLIYFLIQYVKREFNNTLQLLDEKQKAENASMAKSKFIASMSHELRTPLNAILGFSQLLFLKAKDDVMKENIQEITKAGNGLLKLINQVLDFSEIESGIVSLSINRYNLNDLLSDSLSTIKPMADKKSIKIINKIDPSQTFNINVDKTNFSQILLNLLSNAITYNHENGEIIIDCVRAEENKLCLSISDTGKGITPEQQGHLFKAFDRAGAGNSDIGGMGLGLVISKDLIEQMDGSIGFESTEGKGSRFWIKVPLS